MNHKIDNEILHTKRGKCNYVRFGGLRADMLLHVPVFYARCFCCCVLSMCINEMLVFCASMDIPPIAAIRVCENCAGGNISCRLLFRARLRVRIALRK
jgi:hypothetical protein